MTTSRPAPCWIPERIVVDSGGRERCRWVDVAGLRFTDPFFDSTVMRRRRDVDAERWSSVEALRAEAEASPAHAAADVVFVFHVSRCGSTLMSQLFGLDEQTIVLSETPLLDALLRSERPNRDALFTAALRLLARPRSGSGRIVVKTDCWHVFHAATLRRLYPDAPFVLMYRAPAAVIDSHRRMRGMHVVPGLLTPAPFDIAHDTPPFDLDRYAALVLERHYAAMLEIATSDPSSLLVRHEEGFPAAFLRAATWLGLAFDVAERQRIDDRCRYHAKRPGESFAGDAFPSPAAVDLRHIEAIVDALEQRRIAPANQVAPPPIERNRSPAPMP
jgi:hypothetical protein